MVQDLETISRPLLTAGVRHNRSWLRENGSLMIHILVNLGIQLIAGMAGSRCLNDVTRKMSHSIFRCFPLSCLYLHMGSSRVTAKIVPVNSRFACFQLSTLSGRRSHLSQ